MKTSSSQIVLLSCLTLALVRYAAANICAGSDACSKRFGSEQSTSDDASLLQLNLNMDAAQREGQIKATHEAGTRAEQSLISRDANETSLGDDVDVDASIGLAALAANIKINAITVLLCFVYFMVMVRFYPNIYAFRATGAWDQIADAPQTWSPDDRDIFRWIKVSYSITVQEIIDSCGLDSAMMIQFNVMSMEIIAGVGIPNFFILSMLYLFKGDGEGTDQLNWLTINNIPYGSWVFVVVAVMTWYNVIFIQRRLFQWQRFFIKSRRDFLETQPSPQDCTILVEGIDDEFCSDAELKKYFEKMYGKGEIKEAFVVKKIPILEELFKEYKAVEQNLHEVQFYIEGNPGKPRPEFHLIGGDELEYYSAEEKRLKIAIKSEQARIIAEAKKPPLETDLYSTNGWVTFFSRRKCEQALLTRLRVDEDSLVMSVAPDPDDIIWHDLQMPLLEQEALQVIGWGLIAMLAIFYMPLTMGISRIANPNSLKKYEFFRSMFEAAPSLEAIVAGLAPSLGLTIMSCMLPTFLMWIFQGFFYLRANRWAQLELQHFYFWFLIVFVLLVTAIGSSVIDFLETIAQQPFLLFTVLAREMPASAEFYMNYTIVQCADQAMNMLRYMNLGKYLFFARFCDKERARVLSEPEDQDFYGIGSRSARFTLMLIMGIVFSSCSPLMCLFTFLQFAVCRLVYGYLVPYAECRKKDMGGVHWVEQLHHVHLGLFLYIALMVGILGHRASTTWPCMIAAGSFVWWAISFRKWVTKLRWETLCFEDIVNSELEGTRKQRESSRSSYHMPQLEPNIFEALKVT